VAAHTLKTKSSYSPSDCQVGASYFGPRQGLDRPPLPTLKCEVGSERSCNLKVGVRAGIELDTAQHAMRSNGRSQSVKNRFSASTRTGNCTQAALPLTVLRRSSLLSQAVSVAALFTRCWPCSNRGLGNVRTWTHRVETCSAFHKTKTSNPFRAFKASPPLSTRLLPNLQPFVSVVHDASPNL
jgi:hypothetical protein